MTIGSRSVSSKAQPIDRGTLITWPQIARYLGVCVATAKLWALREGLPVAVLPDGRRATTTSLIDAWILARMPENDARTPDSAD